MSVREKTKAEVQNEDRARAGSNALNRLGLAVKYIPSVYAKPVFDLIIDARRAVMLNESYRAAITNRAKGMCDILETIPRDDSDILAVLSEITHMVGDICLTESPTWIEGQDIAALVASLDPYRAKQDAF